ncbi:MAG: sulfide/dihydroorotate dehydrogenase-like FAD/NAD-binding protein [Acidobacteria bacterium]|nr:sulfide/dihydroorotate dehydrogenase-like FAD/NAD-binding protein [Acidobacteriota bacterium]
MRPVRNGLPRLRYLGPAGGRGGHALKHIILRKRELSRENFLIEVAAPNVAERFAPGQFVIIRIHDKGERIPLTVADVNRNDSSITLIFQVVGKTTRILSLMNPGDVLLNVVGPLGNPTEIQKWGRVVCVGGGTGIACVYPIIKALSRAGNTVLSIIGARTKSLLLLEEKIRAVSAETFVTTDDGSLGEKGFVTDVLKNTIKKHNDGRDISLVYVIGPPVMMKAAADVTRPFQIKTIVSLNTIMIDGTGMCGGCRVFIDGEMKLTCIDGPEFDAHKVDFDDVIGRLDMFKGKEKESYACFLKQKGLHD